ncbi:MAG: methyltransferase [Planctomycetota bacterium]
MTSPDPNWLLEIPSSDPAILLRYRDRQYAAELIATAILKFDFFTHLGKHPGSTRQQLCEHFGWHVRPADVLLTLCRASDLIQTDGMGRCTLTPTGSDYLRSDGAHFMGPYYRPLADSPIVAGFERVLKTGKPANWQAKSDGADWHESMLDPDFAREFTELMNCRGTAFGKCLAQAIESDLGSRRRLLDVGGGSGIYAATLVARCPHLHATVLEQPPVDQIASSELDRLGLSSRIDVMSGDMFDDPWVTGTPDGRPDVVLFSNVLHDWDQAEAEVLIQKASEALEPGGLLVIHGAILRADKTGPLPVAEYSALLMNITQGKCYSEAEYGEMLQSAGLVPEPYRGTIGDRGVMTALKPSSSR